MSTTPHPSPDVSDEIPRRAWGALAVSTLVVFLVVVDISAINVAFPSIRDDFDVTDVELSWIIGAYTIVVGSLLMLAGRLADSIGRRRMYLPGVAMFGFGSALCALAPSAGWLVAARIVQALGGAVVAASGFAVMLPEFPQTRRGTAIGVSGASGALGAVAGPVVGSILIDAFSWRAIFWVNVPVCLLVVIIGPRFLRESRDPDATGRIDLVGVALGTTAVALVMFAIVQSESWGVGDWRAIVMFLTGAALVPVLVRRSRHHPEPLLALDLFEVRSFASVNLGVALYGFGFGAGFLSNSLLLQDVWELDIRTVGLALAPGPILAFIASPLSGRLADRIGHRWILVGGCLLLAIAYLMLALLLGETNTVWTRYLPISLLAGVGVGMTVASWSSAGISDVPSARFGVAGATFNTIRQATTGLGVSVCVTVIALAAEETTFGGIRSVFVFVVVAYLLAALAVYVTFPAGSARDRRDRAAA